MLPWLQAQAAQWKSGQFPLWDPNHWTGIPWAGQVQPATLNPLNWLLFSLPFDRDGLIRTSFLQWYWVLIHFLGALFAYLLCLELRAGTAGAIFGGLSFGLGGYMGTTAWPQLLTSAWTLPLTLLSSIRHTRSGSLASAAASGAALGAGFLLGHHNIPIYASAGMLVLWLIRLLSTERKERLRCFASAMIFSLLLALFAAPQVLSARELGQHSLRWAGADRPLHWHERVPYTVHEEYSLRPGAVLNLIVLELVPAHWNLFIGVVVLTLAALGVRACWASPDARLLFYVAAFGLACAMGPNGMLHELLYSFVPGLDKARNPGMAAVFLHLGLAGLASLGVSRVSAGETADLLRPVRRILGIGAVTALVLASAITLFRPEAFTQQQSLAFAGMIALLPAAALAAVESGSLRRRGGFIAVSLLLIVELHYAGAGGFRHMVRDRFALHQLREHRDIAQFLHSRSTVDRVEVNDSAVPYNFGDWFGVQQYNGYLPGAPWPLIEVHYIPTVRNLLGNRYLVSDAPNDLHTGPVFEGRSGIKVFENPNAFPRAFAVHSALTVQDEADLFAIFRNREHDLRQVAVLVGGQLDLRPCDAADEIEIAHYAPARVQLRANMECEGLIVLSDAWFPGW